MIATSYSLLLVVSSALCATIPTSNDYSHTLDLLDDDRYTVFWKFDETTITFEVHAKTLGWVGFGLSPNGGMAGSDVIITWIKDGKLFFTDRHALGKYEPVVDESQDWTLISAQESGEYTIITVSRKHVTGDSRDLCITSGTIRLIYSFNPNDPSSESGPLEKHTVKGARSVQLLSPPRDEPRLPADAFSVDLLMSNGKVESTTDTTYWCEGKKPPSLPMDKYHIVMVEPVVEEGHESFVHHMVLFACEHDLATEEVKQGDGMAGHCYPTDDDLPDRTMDSCKAKYAVWAIGDGKFWFPDTVGLPFGDFSLLKLEIHYDNPNFVPDIVDHSGFRLWLTPTLREHDAGVFLAGAQVSPYIIIPPSSDGYLVQGLCHADCISEAMNESSTQNVNIFATLLHSHLAGFGLRMRHIRDGVELPPIAVDNSYDFNYQTTRMLPKEVMLKQGDSIMVDCAYETQMRKNATFGGLSTTEEMCLGYVYYYPKIHFQDCHSRPSYTQLSNFIRFDEKLRTACYVAPDDPLKICYRYVTSPTEHVGNGVLDVVRWIEWTKVRRDRLQKFSTEGIHDFFCSSATEDLKANGKQERYPVITEEYKDNSIYSECPSAFKKIDGRHTVTANYTLIKDSVNTLVPLSGDYTHSVAILDENRFHVFWKFDDTTITFEVHAKTLGWVGFGLSPNGGMAGSDVIITWVKDGKTSFSDRHALGKYEPVVDESQDWTLISAQESGEYTIITVSRKHVTGDSNDLCVTDGTMKLIYAMNPDDPTSESGSLEKHTVRGSKSVQLLSASREELQKLPDDAFPFDIVMHAGHVMGDTDTTYWCQAALPPSLDSKHHIVMAEPLIEEGHDWLVHHMILYACDGEIEGDITAEEAGGFHAKCLMYGGTHPMDGCAALVYGWAIGGGKFWFPEDIGYPLVKGRPTLFKLEIHYNNPNLVKGIVDHSGLRLWLTPSPRQHDSGFLNVGNGLTDFFIPPKTDNFKVQGICPGPCFTMGLQSSNIPEIKVFGFMLHSHLAGIAIRVRHIRDGVELAPIAVDNSYDFNFQELRHLPSEVVVKAGDDLIVECTYQTKQRQNVTWAGESINNEMCLAFLLFYPRMTLTNCVSWTTKAEMNKILEPDFETKCSGLPGPNACQVTNPVELAGKSVADVINQLEWHKDNKAKIQKISLEGDVQYFCGSTKSTTIPLYFNTGPVPKVTKTYVDDSIYGQCPTAFHQQNDQMERPNQGVKSAVSLTMTGFIVIVQLLQ